jgi:hypothetical protein
MKCLSLIALGMSVALLASCSKPPTAPAETATATTPEARIQQIPPADPQKYAAMRDMKAWRNPYLIVRRDGVALLDTADNEERLMRLEDLPKALASLPASAWPYGRVVAVTEAGVRASGDNVLIRKNRGIVHGTLETMHVLVSAGPPPN